MTSRTRSTYNADCLCGQPITSETRETTCGDCGRVLVFEWGGNLFESASVRIDGETKPAGVIVAEKAKGAGA